MPSEVQRPDLVGHRSTSSIHSQTDSPSTSPPQGQHKTSKPHKHVVGRTHARVPSAKGLQKLTKAHPNDSHENLKKQGRNSSATKLARNSSGTSLAGKKNSSHVSLKRNRSSADVVKRPKSSGSQSQGEGKVKEEKKATGVHFEIGDQEGDHDDGGWEEASSSTSPALSRSASRLSSHPSSGKPSANNSRPESPLESPKGVKQRALATDVGLERERERERERQRPATNAKVITERLLQRTPSLNTTEMTMSTATATATPTTVGARTERHSPDSMGKSHTSTFNSSGNGTPKIGSKEDMVSRFVSGSGTPSENSPFLNNHQRKEHKFSGCSGGEEVKKSQSMGNLSRPSQNQDGDEDDDDTESALAPRSRKSSTTHAYNPPQQSRTQQKLWLQRASSNMEAQYIDAPVNGLTPLVGMGYDGRQDPRIKIQLDRTGLEYLAVRRYQDPVGEALKRLSQLPGAEKNRPIVKSGHSLKKSSDGAGAYGLSQSLREASRSGKDKDPRSSYDGGNQSDGALSRGRDEDDGGVGGILRGIWEKNYDLSASAD